MAELPGEGTYVCTLDAETQKKAKDELNEDPNDRAGKIANVREWLKAHPFITSRTDDIFILRFLRLCKFSVMDTQKRIEQFCINRTSALEGVPEWFANQDVDDPKVREILERPIQFPLPRPKDKKDGPVYVLMVSKNINTKEEVDDIMRSTFMCTDTILMDENVQVHGMHYIQCQKSVGMDILKLWSRDTIKKAMKVWKDVYPTRMKKIHYVHMPGFMEAIFEVIKFFMGKKLSDRIRIHHNDKSLHKKIPKECLPNEYGGTAGTVEELYADFRTKLFNNKQEFELLKQCRVDDAKMPKEEVKGDSWGMVGSYRKFET